MQKHFCFALVVCSLVVSASVRAQQRTAEEQWLPQRTGVTDQERFDFERYNEDRKARIEIWKAVLSGASLLVPLLIGAYSLRAQAKANFELKAAEIVMNARNPFGVRSRADVLRELFPGRLPSAFAESFEPAKHAAIGPSAESKLELLKLIVAHPQREEEIVRLWRRMYVGDEVRELFPGDFLNGATPNDGSRAAAHDA